MSLKSFRMPSLKDKLEEYEEKEILEEIKEIEPEVEKEVEIIEKRSKKIKRNKK